MTHRMCRRARTLALALAACGPLLAAGQALDPDQPVPSMDVFRGVILQVGTQNNGWTLCLGPGESVATVRPPVEAQLQAQGIQGLPTPRQVGTAMRARFPCPFAPQGKARPAEAADLEGAWIMPEGSAQLRYPPRSGQRQRQLQDQQAMPMRCLAVGYFAGGEQRLIELRGQAGRCPAGVADFALARSMPRVVQWSVSPGRLTLTRSDVADHVESWDVYIMESALEVGGVQFQPGDLIQYLRRYPRADNDGYALEFRHLRRLP